MAPISGLPDFVGVEYRSRQPRPEPKPRPTPARALPPEERARVLATLHEPRFVDLAPAEVLATPLDEGRYLCSERTFYRVLAENAEVPERRNQLRHPYYTAPELVATWPNELWSWDITKLLGPEKWTYYYLHVVLDVFSRYVVGWMLAKGKSASLAQRLIAASCEHQDIAPGQLAVHADRGAAMTSKAVALLLADLGVTKSHSRPHVSNDNTYSEAQFKTLKYRPDFPDRIGSLEHGRSFCGDFFRWYNHEHHHVGLRLFTPHDVHFGLAGEARAARTRARGGVREEPGAVPERTALTGVAADRGLSTRPAKREAELTGENTVARQSSAAAIVAPGATSKAVTEVEPLASPHLIPEDQCMAAAQ